MVGFGDSGLTQSSSKAITDLPEICKLFRPLHFNCKSASGAVISERWKLLRVLFNLLLQYVQERSSGCSTKNPLQMMRRAGRFRRPRGSISPPTTEDSHESLDQKWHQWAHAESYKRYGSTFPPISTKLMTADWLVTS